MTKAEAIQTLLECEWLDGACKNIGKKDWEELRQDFWVKVLAQREETFSNIRDLRFYCIKILISEYSYLDKSNRLSKKNEISVDADMPDRPEYDTSIDHAAEQKDMVLGAIPMYDRVIYKLHEKGISQRAISTFTGIGRNEINKTVNRVKQYIAANVTYERPSN